MKHFTMGFAASMLLATAVSAAAGPTVTVTVKLPNGAPAKHASVRMTTMGANYLIVSLETETTSASGIAVFRFRRGACLKAEYGNDADGRPIYIGNVCPKAPGRATIELSR